MNPADKYSGNWSGCFINHPRLFQLVDLFSNYGKISFHPIQMPSAFSLIVCIFIHDGAASIPGDEVQDNIGFSNKVDHIYGYNEATGL